MDAVPWIVFVAYTIILTQVIGGSLDCNRPLGMKDGRIADEQIRASSAISENYGPSKARMDSDSFWESQFRTQSQYLRIDLQNVTNVTSVALQGAKYFTKTFRVYYSSDSVVWSAYRSSPSYSIVGEDLLGNTQEKEVVIRQFTFPIKTRYIMINPTSWESRIALKLELYGCVLADQNPIIVTNITLDNLNDTHVLSAGPYLISDMLHIKENGTLILEPGTHLIFNEENAGFFVEAGGKLLANGSKENPVIFTSYYPTIFFWKEKWSGIEVEAEGNLELSYSELRQAATGVKGPSDSIRIHHSTIYSCNKGIHVTSGSVNETDSFLQSSLVAHNEECGVELSRNLSSPYIKIQDSEISNNTKYGIFFEQQDFHMDKFGGLNTTFENIRLLNNKAYGIHRGQAGTMIINASTISDNSLGGFYISAEQIKVVIMLNKFTTNGDDDIVLYVNQLNLTITDSKFMPSKAAAMKLMCFTADNRQPWHVDIRRNTFRNVDKQSDGLIEVYASMQSRTIIENNLFFDSFHSVYFETQYKRFQFSNDVYLQLKSNIFNNITGSYVIQITGAMSDLTLNKFENCEAGIVVDLVTGYRHTINYNSFVNPKSEVDLTVSAPFNSSLTIDATRNYWGSNVTSWVMSRICGHNCEPDKIRVIINPILLSYDTNKTFTILTSDGSEFRGGKLEKNETIKSGSFVDITSTVVIPHGMTLTIEGKTELRFKPDTGIQVYGTLVTGVSLGSVFLRSFSGVYHGRWDGIKADNGDVFLTDTVITNAVAGLTLYDDATSSSGTHVLQDVMISDCVTAVAGAFSYLQLNSCLFKNNDHGIYWNSMEAIPPPINILISNSSFITQKNSALKVDAAEKVDLNIKITIDQSQFVRNQNPKDNGSYGDIVISHCYSQLYFVMTECLFKESDGVRAAITLESELLYAEIRNNRFMRNKNGINFQICAKIRNTTHDNPNIIINANAFNNTKMNEDVVIKSGNHSFDEDVDVFVHNIAIAGNIFFKPVTSYVDILFWFRLRIVSHQGFHNVDINSNDFVSMSDTAIGLSGAFGKILVFNNVVLKSCKDLILEVSKTNNVLLPIHIYNNTFNATSNCSYSVLLNSRDGRKPSFTNNSLYSQGKAFILLKSPNVSVQYNYFGNPKVVYFIQYMSDNYEKLEDAIIDASYNYWGTSDIKDIRSRVRDSTHKPNYPDIIFLPILLSRNPDDVLRKQNAFFKEDQEIGGIIKSAVRLTMLGSPYCVVSDIEVTLGGILTIGAGVKIYFQKETGINVTAGSLMILGKKSYPVEMVSFVSRSRWKGIEFMGDFNNTEPSVLNNLNLFTTWTGLVVRGDVTLKNVLSVDSNKSGITLDLTGRGEIKALSMTAISNREHGIYITDFSQQKPVSVEFSGCNIKDNVMDGVFIEGSGNITFNECHFINNKNAINVHHVDTGSLTVTNSVFQKNSDFALEFRDSSSNKEYNVQLTGNEFSDTDSFKEIYGYRYLIVGHVNHINRSSWIITNNNFTNCVAYGISIETWNPNSERFITIEDNIFSGISHQSIKVYSHETTSLIILSLQRNIFKNNNNQPYYSQTQMSVVYIHYNARSSSMLAVHHNEIRFCTAVSGMDILGFLNLDLSNVTISHNVIAENTVEKGMQFQIYAKEFHHNIFYNPLAKYEFVGPVYNILYTLNATLNYWGSGELHKIIQRMLFFETNLSYGYIYYLPCFKSLDSEELAVWKQDELDQNGLIGGEITEDVTLTKENGPYVIQRSIMIRKGAQLIIEPGAHLHFFENRGIYVEGSLVVLSSGSEETVFKKVFNGKTAQFQGWYGIIFHGNDTDGSGVSELKKLRIMDTQNALTVDSPCVHMSGCTIYRAWRNCVTINSHVQKMDFGNSVLIDCQEIGINVRGDFDEIFLSNVQIKRAGIAGIDVNLNKGTVVLTEVSVENCVTGIKIDYSNITSAGKNGVILQHSKIYSNSKTGLRIQTSIESMESSILIDHNEFRANGDSIAAECPNKRGESVESASRSLLISSNRFYKSGPIILKLRNNINAIIRDNIFNYGYVNTAVTGFLRSKACNAYIDLHVGEEHANFTSDNGTIALLYNLFRFNRAVCILSLESSNNTFNGSIMYNRFELNDATSIIHAQTHFFHINKNIFNNPKTIFDIKTANTEETVNAKDNWITDPKKREKYKTVSGIIWEPFLSNPNFKCSSKNKCNLQGTCIAPERCICYWNLHGENCTVTNCSAVSDCSKHGLCVKDNICKCNYGWEGESCNVMSRPMMECSVRPTIRISSASTNIAFFTNIVSVIVLTLAVCNIYDAVTY